MENKNEDKINNLKKITDIKEQQKILNIFNSPENRNGDKIKFLFISNKYTNEDVKSNNVPIIRGDLWTTSNIVQVRNSSIRYKE